MIDLLDHERRLGYAVVDDPEQPEYVVYGERQLSTDPNVRRRTDEPFAELDYAIYLGPEESAEQLLGSSLRTLPIDGRRATATSAFGNEQLFLVMTPIGQLNSWLFANLWWMVALAGVLLSLIMAWGIASWRPMFWMVGGDLGNRDHRAIFQGAVVGSFQRAAEQQSRSTR